MTDPEATKRCPKCGALNVEGELPQRDYRCGDCGLELAHLDTLPTGGIRGVLGMLLDAGTLVHGRYRIVAVLGKGGFGVTYLVDDELLHGKRRALKEVPALMFDEYETRLLGRLNHPAIPDISDRFESNGMVYQVLEFGGDRTLRIEKERRGGRIPLFVLLPWMRQLCEALQYLHGQEPPVVHRDLKPDNVLLDEHDRVMLIDFGIAKEASPDTATRTIGRAVSQGFSPPEQVLGTGTDARSDVYALGAIQYFCLTGEMPTAAHERITGQALEPLSKFLPEIPPLIEAAVMQALELNINNRQQSIAELASVFELVQTGSGSAPTISVGAATAATTSSSGTSLPSMELPSRRTTTGRTGANASQPSMDVSQLRAGAAAPPPQPPPTRRRVGLWLTVLVLPLVLAGAGGAWWWTEHGSGASKTTGSDAVTESAANAGEPPVKESGSASDTQLPGAEAPGDAAAALSEPGAIAPETVGAVPPPDASSAQDLAQDGGIQSSAQAQVPQTAADVVEPEEPDAMPDASAATMAAAAGATAAVAATALSSKKQTAAASSPGSSPSIFSDEQPTRATSRSTDTANSAGATTLMDLFDRQRSTSLSAVPTPTDSAAVSSQPKAATKTAKAAPQPAPAPKPAAKPKPKPKVAAAPKPKPKPRPKPKPAASSASDWGFQYKGARKTD